MVFTVSSNTANEILGLKNGSADVNASNYTLDATKLKLTLDVDYLKGLTAGEKTFTILMKTGFNLTVKVTVA